MVDIEKTKIPDDPFRKASGAILDGSEKTGNTLKNSTKENQERTEEMAKNKELAKVVTALNDIRKTSNIENAVARLDDPDIVAMLWDNGELRQYVENVLNKMAAIDHEDDLLAAQNGNTSRVTEALIRDFGGVREGMRKVSLDLGRRLQEASPFDQPSIAQFKEEVDGVVASVQWLESKLLKVETSTINSLT
jgi:hypothetical protein